MYLEKYKIWLELATDKEIKDELLNIKDNEEEIKERFLLDLEFGTAGLRGVLGAGSYRMNRYTVAQSTQGLAKYLLDITDKPSVAIAYDSRIKSDEFSKVAASVLAANGIKVYLYDTLMPTPMLSYAVRHYKTNAGIMVTASHNPAKYNGYKVYGDDGCQMTSESANKVLNNIKSIDIFSDVKLADFDVALKANIIEYVGKEVIESYYDFCLNEMLRKDILKTADLKLVYTPLNGTGNIPVKTVLAKAGLTNVVTVKEQELPDGNFPTCPYPNPEIKQAMQLGLDLVKKENADILIATDPDADRVGIAVKENEDYTMLTGNQVGILLLDYIAKTRIELNKMPENPVLVKSIVTSSLADAVAQSYNVKTVNVLTGFKYIGETIKTLEVDNNEDDFILGFEESYGYLIGTKVRDKDAVVASLLIAEMTAYYKSINKHLSTALNEIYEKFGYYLNVVDSYEFEGLVGMDKMTNIMQTLRDNTPIDFNGIKIEVIEDYTTLERLSIEKNEKTKIDLPKSNILTYYLSGGHQVIIRPSGTEPKIKVYYSIKAIDKIKSEEIKNTIIVAINNIMN